MQIRARRVIARYHCMQAEGSHRPSVIIQCLQLLYKAEGAQPDVPQSAQLALDASRLHITQTESHCEPIKMPPGFQQLYHEVKKIPLGLQQLCVTTGVRKTWCPVHARL